MQTELRDKMRQVRIRQIGLAVVAWFVLTLIVGGLLSTILPPLIAWPSGAVIGAVLAILIASDNSVQGRIVRSVFIEPIPNFDNRDWREDLIETRRRVWQGHTYTDERFLREALEVEAKISTIIEQIRLYERNMLNRPKESDIRESLQTAMSYLEDARRSGNSALEKKAQTFVRLQQQRLRKLKELNQQIESARMEIDANVGTMSMAAATAGVDMAAFRKIDMTETTNTLLSMQGQVQRINADSTDDWESEAAFLERA
ncbi:MAG: hypothetical protein ACP5GX_02725 [Anaerolineae bacterium]